MSDANGVRAPGEQEENISSQLPVAVPDQKLTIEAGRLAGSALCLNCGTALQGPFCHYCGQPDKNLVRFFPALLREMLEDFVDFDSRFMRTIKPLLFRPGKLTRDYLDGRRFRYVPPLRLYIFSSLMLFFLVAVFAVDTIQFASDVDGEERGIRIQLDDTERQELDEALKELDKVQPGLADRVSEEIDQAAREEDATAGQTPPEVDFEVNGKPWDPETNPVDLAWMPGWVNRWINREIGESPEKGRAIEANPNLMSDKVLDVLPGTMFVLLPIVALLFKFWYLFARRYYVEHLIFALHIHAFIFVTFIVMIILGTIAEWREPDGAGVLTTGSGWIRTALFSWIPVYLLLSLKKVYGQGWGLTLGKYFAIGISYLVLLGFATVFVAALSFVLL
jgi:hypothetical protein